MAIAHEKRCIAAIRRAGPKDFDQSTGGFTNCSSSSSSSSAAAAAPVHSEAKINLASYSLTKVGVCNLKWRISRVPASSTPMQVHELKSFDVHRCSAWFARQPFGQIPFIVDGDLTLYETRAIARYIEHKFGDQGTPLYGQTPEDHALTEQWLEVESHHYMGPVHDVVYNVCFAHLWGKKCDDVVVAAGMAKLEAVLDVYEDRLSATEYLAGSFFGLADMSHIPFTYFMIHLAHKGHIFFCRPHVNAWVAKIHSRSSTLKWLNMAGLAK
ncbi:hypothetical protein AXG93_1748s1040 [Marchantia polymorpha subsp. ruderalis]|uniref:glutathione transferase n=1 Tax=Marchantia polymorpha subsp. ruderalis TaxID=1480154 RepID=A0A176VIU9_MARPO|nr:hypothetical protein AXG93_1748s1040 [Marchantia polymorpha subsp. ruderalis]